jgi:hypothetical protein
VGVNRVKNLFRGSNDFFFIFINNNNHQVFYFLANWGRVEIKSYEKKQGQNNSEKEGKKTKGNKKLSLFLHIYYILISIENEGS